MAAKHKEELKALERQQRSELLHHYGASCCDGAKRKSCALFRRGPTISMLAFGSIFELSRERRRLTSVLSCILVQSTSGIVNCPSGLDTDGVNGGHGASLNLQMKCESTTMPCARTVPQRLFAVSYSEHFIANLQDLETGYRDNAVEGEGGG